MKNAFRWTPDAGTITVRVVRTVPRSRSRCRTPGPGSRPTSVSGSSARSSRATRRARASGCRSPGSSPARSAGASSSRARSGRGSRFRLRLPAPSGRCRPAPLRTRRVRHPGPTARRSTIAAVSALEASVVRLPPPRGRRLGLRSSPCDRGSGSKNLLLFAGIVFAAELGDPGRWVACLRRLRRVVRGVERGLPRQRRARRTGGPTTSREALPPRSRVARSRCGPRSCSPPLWSSSRSGLAAALGTASLALPRSGSSGSRRRTRRYAEADRPRRRARDRDALRPALRRRGDRRRRADLALAARVHRAPRALPRAREASRGARARRGAAPRPGGGTTRRVAQGTTTSRWSTSCSRSSQGRRS